MTITFENYLLKKAGYWNIPHATLHFHQRKSGGVVVGERNNEQEEEAYKRKLDIDVGRFKDSYHLMKPPRDTYKKEINPMIAEAGCEERQRDDGGKALHRISRAYKQLTLSRSRKWRSVQELKQRLYEVFYIYQQREVRIVIFYIEISLRDY